MGSLSTAQGPDGFDASPATPTDKSIPVYSDGTPIKWPAGSNPAHLPGILHELKRCFERNGQFIALFENNAVPVGHKLAVDSVQAIKFITGMVSDPVARGFDSPCPNTETRISQFNVHATASKKATFSRDPPPSEILASYAIMPYAVRQEKGRLLASLNNIFEDADKLEQLGERAAGDGVKLLELLNDEARKAKPRDVALVEGDLTNHIQTGILGEINLENFNLFMRQFDRLHRLAPNKKTDGQQISMISTIMYGDPSIRNRYEDKVDAKPPSSREAALDQVRELLRGRFVDSQIDERRRGGVPDQRAFLGNTDPPKDSKVKPPRDKDGKVTKWVKGMDPCKCGANHLYSDPSCPLNKAKQQQQQRQQPQQQAKIASQQVAAKEEAAVVEFSANDSEADIEGKLNMLFNRHTGHKESASARPAQHAKVATVAPPWTRCQIPGCDCGESAPPPEPIDAADACQPIDDPKERAAAMRAVAEAAVARASAQKMPFWRRHPLLFFSVYTIVVAGLVALFAVGLMRATAYSGMPLDQPLAPARFVGALDGQMHAPYDAGAQQRALAAQLITDGTPVGLRSRPMDALGVLFSLLLALYFYWPASFWYITIQAPRDVALALSYSASIPFIGLAAATVGTASIGQLEAAKKGVTSLNRLRHGLPLLVTGALALSAACIGCAARGPHDSLVSNVLASWRATGDSPPSTSGSIVDVALPQAAIDVPSARGQLEIQKGQTEADYHALIDAQVSCEHESVLTGLPLFSAAPDSGCTAHCTPYCSRLVDTAPCDEIFGQANGHISRATRVGRMPVIARSRAGQLVRFAVSNVRCVPDFNYTLLSVTQLWREQQIDTRFADLNHLALPDSAGGHLIAFNTAERLFTVPLVSAPALDSCRAHRQVSLSALGFHRHDSTAHVARMPSATVSALAHRRWHLAVDATRALVQNTSDATKNLSGVTRTSCTDCAASQIRRASHSGSLRAPAGEPGELNMDLKGPFALSTNGFRYAAFFIDSHSRFVIVMFLKDKSEITTATKLAMAEFDALVGVPVDSSGAPLARPRVRSIRSDHEGGVVSHAFDAFRADAGVHLTLSPPHDHDLNPISERAIGVIDTLATTMKSFSGAPVGFWPWLIMHAVNVHNCTAAATGSSTADPQVSSYQRFTLKQPPIMDLVTFGCRAVALKPRPFQRKGDLSTRGWVGIALGRSLTSIGCQDVWVPSIHRVVQTSSMMCDEEYFPWRNKEAHQPLPAAASAPAQPQPDALGPATGNQVTPLAPGQGRLGTVLSLFSGPYARAGSLADKLTALGWASVRQIDSHPEKGGGGKITFSTMSCIPASSKPRQSVPSTPSL